MQELHQHCLSLDIAPIYVITPATPEERIRKINHYARGFLYYACRKGTTGIRSELPSDFEEKIHLIKSIVHLPVVVGFGISKREMATKVLQHADGIVIGSLFVKALEDGTVPANLTVLAHELCPISRNIYDFSS